MIKNVLIHQFNIWITQFNRSIIIPTENINKMLLWSSFKKLYKFTRLFPLQIVKVMSTCRLLYFLVLSLVQVKFSGWKEYKLYYYIFIILRYITMISRKFIIVHIIRVLKNWTKNINHFFINSWEHIWNNQFRGMMLFDNLWFPVIHYLYEFFILFQ